MSSVCHGKNENWPKASEWRLEKDWFEFFVLPVKERRLSKHSDIYELLQRNSMHFVTTHQVSACTLPLKRSGEVGASDWDEFLTWCDWNQNFIPELKDRFPSRIRQEISFRNSKRDFLARKEESPGQNSKRNFPSDSSEQSCGVLSKILSCLTFPSSETFWPYPLAIAFLCT